GVHDQQIAGFDKPGQLNESGLLNPLVVAPSDQQPDFVPGQAPCFGRLRGLEDLGKLEFHDVERGEQRGHGETATAWARYRPLGRSPSTRARRPGTATSGSGRSEMSSPGNAS